MPEAIGLGSAELTAYLRQCLREGRGGERLGAALTDELFRFVEREGGLLDEWDGSPCLTHSDFGGTNILVRRREGRWQVAGVLDWEFAFSGTPFFDFGNLLRRPLGDNAAFVAGVAEGYRMGGGHLPDRWREMAAMTDLYAWAEFLNRPVISPAVIEDARRVIAALIASSAE